MYKRQVRDLLSEYGFPGDDIPVVKGSSLQVLESTSTNPDDEVYKPMKELMAVSYTHLDNVENSNKTDIVKKHIAIEILLNIIMGRSSKLYKELYNDCLLYTSYEWRKLGKSSRIFR